MTIRKIILSLLFSLLLLTWTLPVRAVTSPLTLTLEQVNLSHAIRMMASFMKINVIVSASITGTATLTLNRAEPQSAFDLLLTSHGLSKWQFGNVWYVAPRELIKRKQEELRWQEAGEAAAPLVTEVWQIRFAKADEIARLLQDSSTSLISKRGHVRVDMRTNVICIQDVAERIALARKLIQKLDVPVKQILIEARLASVDSDCERELGIIFGVKAAGVPAGNLGRGPGQNAGLYSLAIAELADGSVLDVKLSALENEGHAELISTPSLFTANQQPASIEAGEEVPYQEVSESGGTAVTFKKAVLGLSVTPQVLPGNKVLLKLRINQDRPSNRMVQGVPTISTRQIDTNVLVKAGQTVVLGGIYETNGENGQQRLPFLSNLPLIGVLFQEQLKRESKRELLIFVTPKIIT